MLLLLRCYVLLLVLVPAWLLLLGCGWDDNAHMLLIRLQGETAATTQRQVSNSNTRLHNSQVLQQQTVVAWNC
jgi:hypothetical protein